MDVGDELEKERESSEIEKGDISIKEVTHDEVESTRDEIVPMEKTPPPKESFILTKDDLDRKKASKSAKKEKKARKKIEKKAAKVSKKEKKKAETPDKKEEKTLEIEEKQPEPEKSDKEEIKKEKPKIRLKKYDDSFIEKLKRWQTPMFLAIVLIIGVMILSQPADLGFIEDKAAETFTNSEQAKIVNSVIFEFPYMSAMEKDKIARDRVSYMLDSDGFKQGLSNFVDKTKSRYKTPSGKIYLFGVEAHNYLSEASAIFDGSEEDFSLVSRAVFYFHSIAFPVTGSLLESMFYFPLVVGLLSILLVFFIGRRLSTNLGGFFAAFIWVIHPSFFINYSSGWIGTSSLTVALSLIAILLLTYAIDLKKKSIIYLVIAVPVLFLMKLSSPEIAKADSIYPSVIIGFKSISFSGIVDALGGPVISLFAFIGIIYLGYLIYKRHGESYNLLFVVVWFGILLIASMVSGKFFCYLAPAFCTLVAVSVFYALPYFEKSLKQINLSFDSRYLKPAITIIVISALFFTLSNDLAVVNDVSPSMNDGIAFTANYIKQNSPEGSVANSWGELGYLYEYYSERDFIMDSDNLAGMKLYLFSRAMMATDEYLAKDLLKVIDCGIGETFFSEEELKMLTNEELDVFAREKLNSTAPQSYLVVSEEDYKKLPLMASFAEWNFRKRFMLNDVQGMDTEEAVAFIAENYNMSEEDAKQDYLELEFDDKKGIKFSKIAECEEFNELIMCKNGFVINGTDARAGNSHPAKLYLYEGGNKTVVKYEGTRSDLSLVVFVTKKGWRSVVVDEKTAESVIVRALAGEKFDGMELVYQVTSPYQINTYKID